MSSSYPCWMLSGVCWCVQPKQTAVLCSRLLRVKGRLIGTESTDYGNMWAIMGLRPECLPYLETKWQGLKWAFPWINELPTIWASSVPESMCCLLCKFLNHSCLSCMALHGFFKEWLEKKTAMAIVVWQGCLTFASDSIFVFLTSIEYLALPTCIWHHLAVRVKL